MIREQAHLQHPQPALTHCRMHLYVCVNVYSSISPGAKPGKQFPHQLHCEVLVSLECIPLSHPFEENQGYNVENVPVNTQDFKL